MAVLEPLAVYLSLEKRVAAIVSLLMLGASFATGFRESSE